ncbi:DNA phosphorothioation-dependent restriction protein DptG [Thiomicrorhabdus indica]|uniref:DNA phosphorothioation-dependent restriction protein DptG n=1 Tax=Thiomicrorhabdus indica TaxID=2267253 RepID=UPI00102D8E69|nr:DNA phosphorothioation-dependent restriction protein DptG [Thiomicrorhabdus indica]
MLHKLESASVELIGIKNVPPESYYPLTAKDVSKTPVYDLKEIMGLLVSYVSEKKLPYKFDYDEFKASLLSDLKKDLSDPTAIDVIEAVFFPENKIPTFSIALFQAHTASEKSRKFFQVFKLLMKQDDYQIKLSTKLNFLEQRVEDYFLETLEVNNHNDQTVSYLPFLDDLFTQDIAFLSRTPTFFKENAEKFLQLYLFLYVSQLALNLHPHTFERPVSRPLYFMLNYEKASKERSKLVHNGYKTLYEHAKYIFPYLSLLETLQKVTEQEDLRLYELPEQVGDSQSAINAVDQFNKEFRLARKLPEKDFSSMSLNQSLNELMNSCYEQFKDQSTRGDVFEKYRRAFDRQICSPFTQARQGFGKILVFDQDYIVLLTNIAIADKGQIRFQELISKFEARGVYFDQKSKMALLDLFEKVGNIDRKSDSGDAVYVKSTI